METEEQGVLVEEQDLRLKLQWIQRVLYGLLAMLAGLFGAVYLSLGLGFFNPNLVYLVAFVMATYGYSRNFLIKRILVGQRYRTAYYLTPVARLIVVASLGLVGAFFQWASPLDDLKEGGLSLFQFLVERGGLRPVFWLKRGMRKVEKQLRILGISVPRGTLSFGVAYAILNGTDMESEIRTIGDWMRNPKNQHPWPSIDSILFQAK